VDSVANADWNVQRYQAEPVGGMQFKRFFERLDKLAQSRQMDILGSSLLLLPLLLQMDVLCRCLVEALPNFVVHVKIILRQALFYVLRRLVASTLSK